MDYGDYYWGLYRSYRDPFPHSVLSTRQSRVSNRSPFLQGLGHIIGALINTILFWLVVTIV